MDIDMVSTKPDLVKKVMAFIDDESATKKEIDFAVGGKTCATYVLNRMADKTVSLELNETLSDFKLSPVTVSKLGMFAPKKDLTSLPPSENELITLLQNERPGIKITGSSSPVPRFGGGG